MRMNLSEDFLQLLEQITYIDQERGTDVIYEITEVIGHAKAEGLSPDEITVLVKSRVESLIQRGSIVAGEQYGLVQQLIEELPAAMANA